jgi:hypothetical protein
MVPPRTICTADFKSGIGLFQLTETYVLQPNHNYRFQTRYLGVAQKARTQEEEEEEEEFC